MFCVAQVELQAMSCSFLVEQELGTFFKKENFKNYISILNSLFPTVHTYVFPTKTINLFDFHNILQTSDQIFQIQLQINFSRFSVHFWKRLRYVSGVVHQSFGFREDFVDNSQSSVGSDNVLHSKKSLSECLEQTVLVSLRYTFKLVFFTQSFHEEVDY